VDSALAFVVFLAVVFFSAASAFSASAFFDFSSAMWLRFVSHLPEDERNYTCRIRFRPIWGRKDSFSFSFLQTFLPLFVIKKTRYRITSFCLPFGKTICITTFF